MRPSTRLRLVLAAIGTFGAVSGAVAGDRFQGGFHRGHGGFHGRQAVAVGGLYGPGFDGTDIGYRGGYGAPILRFPRPDEIVPPAWGYGTYGVPTMPGIRQAPAGTPTVLVIDGVGPEGRRRSSAPRILARGADGQWSGAAAEPSVPGGPRIVQVRVPRR